MTPDQLEQARRFLAKVVPWQGDFADIVTCETKNGRKIWGGRADTTLDGLVGSLDWLSRHGERTEFYACMSSQRTAQERTGKNDHKFYLVTRSQDNAVALKSLFIDIDFKGGEHGYDTAGHAVAALAEFLKAVNLPKPSVIVWSGGGMHIYFTFAEPLPRDEWKPLAYALAEAGKRHGLKADWQVTIDSARILRVPGTTNNKQEAPRPVVLRHISDDDYSVERLWQSLEPYKTSVPAAKPQIAFEQPPTAIPTLRLTSAINEEMRAGAHTEYAAVHLDDLAKECAFIRDAIATGGAKFPNPMWNLTTLIAVFTDDPRNDAHRMGNLHPGYTKESTDEFFDRKAHEKEEKGLGFPSCASISGSGCTACQACPHFTNGRSPLATARPRVPAAPAAQAAAPGAGSNTPGIPAAGAQHAQPNAGPVLPAGYAYNADRLICWIERNTDGTDDLIPICPYEIHDPWLQDDPHVFHFKAKINMGVDKSMSIDGEAVNTMDMRRTLQAQGLMLPAGDKALQRVGNFMSSWITHLQQTRDSVRSAPFGWTVEKGKVNGFVFGGTVWMNGADRPAASADAVIARHYAPQGELQPWLDASDMITSQGRSDLAVLFASTFAAPLVRFTGHSGVLLSTYSSESGVGKSTALKVAQAVWGSPEKAIQMLTDTQNSVMNKLGILRSLPLYWDELKTEEDTRKFVNITFQTTQGKEKSRMSRNISQREPGSWQTLLISASNDSLLDFILQSTNTTTAGLFRIFEFPIAPIPAGATKLDSSAVTLMTAKLADNHGHAGLAYAKFLGANHQTIEKEMEDYLKELGKELNTSPDERFWLALIAVVLMGAKYANQLGLTKFDLGALKGFMVRVLGLMRGHREAQPVDMNKDINLSSVLQRFLTAHRARHMLITNRIHVGKGKPPRGSITPHGDTSKLDGIYVHIGSEDKIMRISSSRMSFWLREIGYSREMFMDKLEKQFGMRRVVGRLGGGLYSIGLVQGTEHLLEIDLAGNPILDFIDEQ